LGLPVAVAEVELVAEGAVGGDGLAAGLECHLWDERPAVRLGGVGQEAGEGRFQGTLVLNLLAGVGLERVVIGVDGLVRRLDLGGGHGPVARWWRGTAAIVPPAADNDSRVAAGGQPGPPEPPRSR